LPPPYTTWQIASVLPEGQTVLTAVCCSSSPGNAPSAAALHTEAINQHYFYDLLAHNFTAKKSL
jgi:hypothetical protein